ncbi:DUF3987 domain-containing protein [Parabacteroides sp. ZJ-118]|uniref:DUF3987 domain-containing protein n=1 Tax=Parabacteroides sp. ZJ-118 TaxID=2709398 RepID=UPI0013EA5CBC|nr:DUF3987 domain-containing protein [Parabacteroides sp. ZJ-118]
MNPLSDLERLVAAIEKQGANIAPTYQAYMPIAFAIANDCGEAGRPFFHRICRLSEKYVSDEADKLFDHALKEGNGRNGLGSVFHWAEIAGVKPDKQLAETARAYTAGCDSLTPERAHDAHTIESPETLPACFPERPWPAFLRRLLDCGNSPAQRDILLLGAVTVLGATLNKRLRILYGRKFQYPCLQTFIVAPPASGKGALTWVRRLAEPFHDALMADYREKYDRFRTEKAEWDALGKQRSKVPEPKQPPLRMFLIAGNNSGTGILENLIEAEGIGLICETEADTVSAAIDTEHGHWSDTLRKCHDHERLSFNRRTNKEYRECAAAYLSVLLSGTPAQVKPLIPSAENGLFSRQLFYFMPSINEWTSQFHADEVDYDQRFIEWGRQWKQVVDRIAKEVNLIQLRLSEEQEQRFDRHFAQIFSHAGCLSGGSMRSTVVRIAINACRILSVVALLRAVERLLPPQQTLPNAQFSILKIPGLSPSEEIPEENVRDGIVPKLDLRVTDEDFESVMSLVEPLYRHSCHILGYLPSVELVPQQATPLESLFKALPLEFCRKQAAQEAEKNGISPNTLDSCLRRMVEKGTLVRNGRGEYAFASRVRTCVREKEV